MIEYPSHIVPQIFKAHFIAALNIWLREIYNDYGVTDCHDRPVDFGGLVQMSHQELDDILVDFVADQSVAHFGSDEDGIIEEEWEFFQEKIVGDNDWLKGLSAERKDRVDKLNTMQWYAVAQLAMEIVNSEDYLA